MADRKTVLVVEDSAVAKQILEKMLTGFYEILSFPNGMSAIPFINAKEPDIDAAVLDMVMRGHGASVGDTLRKIPKYKGIPIIYHTSLMKEQFDNRVLEGAHYVQKKEGSVLQIMKILQASLGKAQGQ